MKLFEELRTIGNKTSVPVTEVAALLATHASRGIVQIAADLRLAIEASAEVERTARETSTHFVWPIVSNWYNSVGLYIHEYKAPTALRAGYADSIHDHRYDFASLILSGGYVESRYEVRGTSDMSPQMVLASQRELQCGDVTTVQNFIFHRISDIQERTLTLVVKLAAVKSHSTSFDVSTGQSFIHVPVEARKPDVLAMLAKIEAQSGR